jgi:anaerobic C4-dicarboxylate transporter
MEEAEVPLEDLQEQIHHRAEHGGEAWLSWVALSTALLAVLAAISGLLSGAHANEAMLNQIQASDQWSYYQAKSIKSAILEFKMSMAATADEKDLAKKKKYDEEQAEIKTEAEKKETESRQDFHKHEVLARGVTLFQIAIAVAAISALTKKRAFWLGSLVFGALGCVSLIHALMLH